MGKKCFTGRLGLGFMELLLKDIYVVAKKSTALSFGWGFVYMAYNLHFLGMRNVLGSNVV